MKDQESVDGDVFRFCRRLCRRVCPATDLLWSIAHGIRTGILPNCSVRTKWVQELACPATRYFWGLSLAESGMMIKARFNCRSGARTPAGDRSWSFIARIFY